MKMHNLPLKIALSPDSAHVLINKGTEPPFTGKWLYTTKAGVYICGGCGNELFDSTTKYDSGSGWLSFWDVKHSGVVQLEEDTSLGVPRTEVICSRCKGHVGHVFEDGPEEETGTRYCINSVALDFVEKAKDTT